MNYLLIFGLIPVGVWFYYSWYVTKPARKMLRESIKKTIEEKYYDL